MAVTDPEERIQRLIRAGESRITEEFVIALTAVRRSINLTDLAALLEQGRFDEAFRVVGRAAARLGTVWGETFTAAGRGTGDWLTRNPELGEVLISFDQSHGRAVNLMRENQLRLVREFTEQQRLTTVQALTRGIQEGANPIEQARAFRNSIGLTSTQERWVENYRRNLSQLDSYALERQLRDKRFDRTVARAIEQGKPLPQAKIDQMVERYRERALRYRSEMIARTESLRATHMGVREMYDQAIDAGQLDSSQLESVWNTAGDEDVRDFPGQTSHRSMHNQKRRWGEPFISGAGNQAFHPGTFGVAYEDIHCRCVVSTRITTDLSEGLLGVSILEA